MPPDAFAPENTSTQIAQRVSSARITRSGPLTLVVARSLLLVIVQGLLAAAYALRHNPQPWHAAAPWWSVYATLVDLGYLALLRKFTR
jgi:hypothetical protein